MIFDLSYLDSDTVIFALTSFLIGFSIIILYNEIRSILSKHSMSNDQLIKEIISTYDYKINEFAKAISDSGIRVDILELKTSSQSEHRSSI